MRQDAEPTGYFALGYLLVIILCANDFLNLGDWVHIHGTFNIRDLGNALVMIGTLIMLVKRNGDPALRTSMSLLILLYLFMISLHVAVASFLYGQPLKDGILSARHQFYYLSFFLFVLVLDTPYRIERFLNMLTLLAVVIFMLGIINYMGFTLFSHKWAEGQGERAGVTRGFLPAMEVVSIAALWEFSKFVQSGKLGKGGVTSVILFGAHVFRQTRMRTIGLIGVFVFLLVRRRQWRTLLITGLVGFVAIVILEVVMEKHVITSQLTSAVENVVESEGSWRGRIIQLQIATDAFLQHPIMGTGSAVLRAGDAAQSYDEYRELSLLQLQADLGYATWLKSFGIIGMLWLLAFYFVWWKMIKHTQKRLGQALGELVNFGSGLLLWLAGTFVTLNHFMYVGGITMVCLGAAIVVRVHGFGGSYTK